LRDFHRIAFNKNFAELFFTDQQLGNLDHSQVKWLATAIPTLLHSTALPWFSDEQ